MTHMTHFLLNDHEVQTAAPAGTLVLDFLRTQERLVGTKEGCKEGDCGACVVLIGQLRGDQVVYEPVTSCLMPVAELQGKHLVTIEGLNMEKLTPVQQAIVDEGGSQCGFCTPGIVVSLTGYLMHAGAEVSESGVLTALGGNLCRCTGYASLKRAGMHLVQRFHKENKTSGRQNGARPNEIINELVSAAAIPGYFQTVPDRLKKLQQTEPNGSVKSGQVIIAGGTDIYVQRGHELPEQSVIALNLNPELRGIAVEKGEVHVGALTTFEEFGRNPLIKGMLPEIERYNHYNASWQIRNRATLGGNIINASPIGDMTALLLALGSELILQNGKKQRSAPMISFFKGYKQLDKKPSEILTKIVFPVPGKSTHINFEKVSKRKTLDIASVNSAIKLQVERGVIRHAGLSMGGVAPIPLFMRKTCGALKDQPVNRETVASAIKTAVAEISPISDIRGSADYKRLLVRQLLMAHFVTLFPKRIKAREFYETP